MDDVESAIVAVAYNLPAERSEDWFAVVCGAFDESGGDWSLFRETLIARANESSFASEVAESFVMVMENDISDPSSVLAQMTEQRDELPQRYTTLLSIIAEAEGQGDAPGWADDRAAPADKGYEESTGLYYDAEGYRYRRDESGEDHVLQQAEGGLYWVSTDGTDHWYQPDFTPYAEQATTTDTAAQEEPAAEEPAAEPTLSAADTEAAEAMLEEVAAAVSESIDEGIKAAAEEFGIPVEDVLRLYEEAIEPEAIAQAVQAGVQAGA